MLKDEKFGKIQLMPSGGKETDVPVVEQVADIRRLFQAGERTEDWVIIDAARVRALNLHLGDEIDLQDPSVKKVLGLDE